MVIFDCSVFVFPMHYDLSNGFLHFPCSILRDIWPINAQIIKVLINNEAQWKYERDRFEIRNYLLSKSPDMMTRLADYAAKLIFHMMMISRMGRLANRNVDRLFW